MKYLRLYSLLWILTFLFVVFALFLQNADLNSYAQPFNALPKLISDLKSEWVFSEKNRLDLWVTALFLYFPIWIWQVKKKKKATSYTWLFVFGVIGIVCLESGLYSRLAFSLGIIPLTMEMIEAANQLRKETGMSRFDIRIILYYILCLVIALPGFYLPPFYDGISGWTVKSEEINLNEIIYERLEVTDSRGNTAPFPYPCFTPISMEYRFLGAINFANKNPFTSKIPTEQFETKRAEFFIESFTRCLIFLRQGKFPYQWLLGDYAYPTHNLSKKPKQNVYDKIIEDSLVKIEFVTYINIKDKNTDFKTIRKVKETYPLVFDQ